MNNKFTVLLIFAFVISSAYVFAQQPGIPHQFYGNATYNGAAAEGLSVDAYIDGVKVASTTTSGGKYGYSPIFLIKDPNGLYEGKTIKFYLNSVDTGQTYNFFNGESTKLDLAAIYTGPAAPTPPSGGGGGGGGSSGGSGGGGGGGSSATTTTAKTTTTTSTTSTTTGSQNSGTGNETQPEITPTDDNKGFSGITGAVTGVVGSPLGIGVLIFILAIVAVSIYVFIMRKRAEK